MYRIVMYIKDLNNNYSAMKEVKQELENNRYPEFVHVTNLRETDIGDWDDTHPLNQSSATEMMYEAYFPEIGADAGDLWLKQEHQRVRSIMLSQIQQNQNLQSQNQELRAQIEKLKKVQEFVDTVKDLVK